MRALLREKEILGRLSRSSFNARRSIFGSSLQHLDSDEAVTEIVLPAEDDEKPPQPPNGWELEVIRGSGTFVLKRDLPRRKSAAALDAEKAGLVLVTCHGDNGKRFREGPNGSSAELTHQQRRPPVSKFAKIISSNTYPELPCFFSALVLRPEIDDQRMNELFQAPSAPLGIEALISVPPGSSSMTMEGLVLHTHYSTINPILDAGNPLTPDDATALRYRQYMGPVLNQRRLAEEAVFQYNSASKLPVYLPAHAHSFEYDQYRGSSGLCRHNKYGHIPVHTIEPELYDSVHAYFTSPLINVGDGLAQFVRRYANYNNREERKMWRASLMTAFARRRSQ